MNRVQSMVRSFARACAITCLALPGAAFGQNAFSSGSTGADGPLAFYAPPSARSNHRMAYDADRQVVVMFGSTGSDATTYEWDGTKWTGRAIAGPSARQNHAMAYDAARKVTVLFGGDPYSSTSSSAETWEYDGATWTQRTPAAPPAARYQHHMAWDSVRQRVVLFGGIFDGAYQNDTWEWDGITWTRRATSTQRNSSSNSLGAMAFDDARGVAVLVGSDGYVQEWNGTNWTIRNPATGINPGNYPSMSYDPVRGRVVLYGGQNNSKNTYLWDGQAWTARDPGVLGARQGAAMAFDAARERLVLFGGYGWDVTALFDGNAWTLPPQTQSTTTFDMSPHPDGVWNFTTIDVAAGVTLAFVRNAANTPVVWLATGSVNIAGIVRLNGDAGSSNPSPGEEALGGPGGFRGGRGGRRFDVSGSYAGTPGEGPGGGLPGVTAGQAGGMAGYATAGSGALGGSVYGNRLLQPLVGGSGGGGGASSASSDAGNGGGGGGALLVASSDRIKVDGQIQANGGAGYSYSGGHGSGGGIRLVANRVDGAGSLNATTVSGGDAGAGRIRIEGFYVTIPPGNSDPVYTSAPPLSVGVTTSQGTIRITEVAGQVVPLQPLGDTNAPDVIFSQAGPVQVRLATSGVPRGTVLTVRITSAGQVITAQSTAVDASGNAVATATVPAGTGTIQAFGEFVPAP